MDTFPSPLARRNRPSIEGKGKEGEREEKKKKGEGKKVRSGGRHFFLFFFDFAAHTQHISACKSERDRGASARSSHSVSSCTCRLLSPMYRLSVGATHSIDTEKVIAA